MQTVWKGLADTNCSKRLFSSILEKGLGMSERWRGPKGRKNAVACQSGQGHQRGSHSGMSFGCFVKILSIPQEPPIPTFSHWFWGSKFRSTCFYNKYYASSHLFSNPHQCLYLFLNGDRVLCSPETFLSPPPQCWDYRCVLPNLLCSTKDWTQGFVRTRQTLCLLSYIPSPIFSF